MCSLGVKLNAAPGAPSRGQVLACHLLRRRSHGRPQLVILRQLPRATSSSPRTPTAKAARRTGKGTEIRVAAPAAWDRFGSSASPADTGLGGREPAEHEAAR